MEDQAAANHSGRLTDQQQRRVAAEIRAETASGLVNAGVTVGLLLLFLLVGIEDAHVGPAGYAFFGGLLLLALLLMGGLLWRRARLLAEVQAGELAHATGHVEFVASRYRARVPGRSLDLTGFNLAAGSYDFSYLPLSGRVVAAELAAADSPTQAQDELRHALAVANRFNLDDLPAYREGWQGAGAFRRLRRLWSTTGWLLLLALGLLMLFVYMTVGVVPSDLAPLVFVVAMFVFLWALGSGLGPLGRTPDVLGGQVRSARGEVRKRLRVTHGRYTTMLYYYTLDGQDWLVSAEAYRALIEGQRYRVYYLPRSKKLVGIEPL